MGLCRIKVKDLGTLLKAVTAAGVHQQIGHQSIDHTEAQIKALLNQRIEADRDVVMSALWSAKMLSEMQLLKRNTGTTFEELVESLGLTIDDYYFWEVNKEIDRNE